MALIKTETLETATGTTKQIYDKYMEKIKLIPLPLQLYSASPTLLVKQAEITQYFGTHDNLSFPLLCLIRYISAAECRNQVCETLNFDFLKRQGMDNDEIANTKSNPMTAPVEPKEQLLLDFVKRAVANPDDIDADDIEILKKEGWTEQDIFDAAYHGVNMVSSGLLTRIFKV